MLSFQALTWELQNKRPPDFKRKIQNDKHIFENSTQVIHCCGRMENAESVRIAIIGYHPHFFARISESEFDRCVSTYTYRYEMKDRKKIRKYEFEDWWVVEKYMVDKTIYQGFKNGEKDTVLKVICANQACMSDMITALTEMKDKCELFDIRQDVLCSFYHETCIKPCGWLSVECVLEFEDDIPFGYEVSKCDYDYVVRLEDVRPIEKIEVAPFKICSLDIEAFTPISEDGKYAFPDPEVSSHQMSCICVRKRLLTQDAKEGEYIYFSYKPLVMQKVNELCEKENIRVSHKDSKACESEKEMLVNFVSFFEREKFDIIVGWNTLDFDMRYIYHRCKLYGIDLYKLSKWGTKETKKVPPIRDVTLSTAGAGHNRFRYWNISGVFQMDELVVVRRDKKYDTYKLGAVSNIVLGDTKIDESPSEIHRKSQGTAEELSEIVVYCMKDTKLPDEIACKLQSYMKNFMFSNMATVPITYLLTRGANIKTSSFITKNVRKRDMIISNKHKWFNQIDGKYEGATVLDAKKGFYDEPVSTLDFKSLYPSIFISQVLDPHVFVESEVYLGIPGVRYKNHNWIDKKSGKKFNYWIVTNGNDLGIPAVIPEIMQELWDERDSAKKRMKNSLSYTEKSVFDGIQLAVKLLMNSIYGFFGAVNASPIPHLPLAMICTFTGRKFIEESQKFVLAKYGNYENNSEVQKMTLEERMKLSLKDLECENVVNVYGDTDSIFVKWKSSDKAISLGQTAILEENFKQSALAAEEITTWLLENHCPVPKRVEMEFEKVYYSLISYSKKRYIGLLWTKVEKPDYIDYKGVQPVRRDTPKILKSTIQKCIELILVEKNRLRAFSLLEETFARIDHGDYEIHEFAKTGAISNKKYVGTIPPAAEVAERLKKRGLPVGERVPYVYVVGNPKEKASSKVEDPDFIIQNNLKVDTRYYLNNQFKKPIIELLGPALDGLDELIEKYMIKYSAYVSNDEAEAIRKSRQNEMRVAPITSFFKKNN
jgi:DNA polymerase delta subunit 1